jgi:hypothetical protein
VRCPRCGNENPGTNRFCGMCGATLLPGPPAATTPGEAPQSSAGASTSARSAPPVATTQSVTGSQPSVPAAEPTPVISGPSFLGLNQPAHSSPSKRGSLSIDPSAAPSSRNLDYLLEDDEPKKGGAGKFILIVIVLLLVVGLGYLRWKNQGFGWLGKNTSKPPAAQTSDGQDANASPAPAATNMSPSPAQPTNSSQPNSSQPAATPDAPPAASNPASNPATNSAANPVSPNQVAGAAPPDKAPPAASTGTPNNTANSMPSPQPSASKDSDDSETDKPPAAPVKPKSNSVPKPAAARPTATADPVAEAQKYLYGKGVRQDCDRGLRILKPAADQSNPKAMIEMGALYSAGLCTPRDLPTAYRWFAMALRKEPDNQAVQTDLQKLWGEMTQPERQLAIRLSQ